MCSRGTLLKRQPEKIRGSEPVHCGPTAAPVADKRGDMLFASEVERTGEEALLDWSEGGSRTTDARTPRETM